VSRWSTGQVQWVRYPERGGRKSTHSSPRASAGDDP
jgi:hypothetical protein